ncbi:MAG: thioredoxin family protein [Bacteroidota bacterium]
MRIVSGIMLAFLLLVLVAPAQDKAPATAEFYDIKYDAAANPFRQLDAAKEEAAKSGKRILLDIGGEWCIWCHRMDDLFRANKDLSELLTKNYVIAKINVSMENKNEIFMAQFPKVAGYPHLYVLEADGKLVHSQDTGQLEEGKDHSKEKVTEFLKKWRKS